MSVVTDDPVYLRLAGGIAELEEALLTAHPSMPTLLRQVHSNLLQNPAAIHSLDDDQIAVIIGSLKKHTATELIAKAPKPKSEKALLKEAGKAADLLDLI